MIKQTMAYKCLILFFLSSISLYGDSNPAFELGTSIGKSIGGWFSSKESEKVDNNNTSESDKSAGGIGGFFGSLFKEPTQEEVLKNSNDKEITKVFYDLQKNSKLRFSFSKNKISSESTIVPFDAANMFYQARSLCAQIDSSNDEIAKTYKSAVTARGNYYEIYTGTVNSSIIAIIQGGLPSVNRYNDEFYKYDFDNAIIEYSQDGTMISSLVRFNKITLNSLIKSNDINYANIRISQVSTIYMRESISLVSRTMSRKVLEENLVMSGKKVNPVVTSQISTGDKLQQPTSKVTQIKELFELYKAGGLTKDEFEKEKMKLLESDKLEAIAPVVKPKQNQNAFEAMMLQKLNQKNGTNFATLQEVQQYMADQKYK